MIPRRINIPRICLLVVTVTALLATVATFTARPAFRRGSTMCLFAEETTETEKDSDLNEDPVLSDVDAKVLRSMLQDTEKLDLKTETNMKRLLERGVKAKEAPTGPPIGDDDDDDSEYASQALKTLANTKLWRSLRAKAGSLLQSTAIFLSNRIERDAKLLASVGVYAMNRAATDFARALPAAKTTSRAVGKAVLLLGNTSSFQDVQQAYTKEVAEQRKETGDIRDQLNTPLDEIKTVSEAIRDILSGEVEGSVSSSRGLRNVAQAGQAKMGERQRRAFKRRQETTLRDEKRGPIGSVGSTAKSLAGAAFEARQELRGERSLPGYRTKKLRIAIEAGAESTTKFIEAARQGDRDAWRGILFGPDEKDDATILDIEPSAIESEPSPMLDSFVSSMTDNEDEWQEPDTSAYDAILELELPEVTVYEAEAIPLPTEIFDEPANIVARLRYCISKPEDTWLTRDVLRSREGVIDEKALREVVTAMICSRDDLEGQKEALGRPTKTIDEAIQRLEPIKGQIETIGSLAADCAGPAAATSLRYFLYGVQDEDEDGILLLLDEFKADWEADVNVAVEEARLKTDSSRATREAAESAKEEARIAKQELIEESEKRKEEIRLAREAAEAKRVEDRRRAAEEADRRRAAEEADRIIIDAEDVQTQQERSGRFAFFAKPREETEVFEPELEQKTISFQDVEVVSATNTQGSRRRAPSTLEARDAVVTSVETSTVEVEVEPDIDDPSVVAASVEIVTDEEFEETELAAAQKVVTADGEDIEGEEGAEKSEESLFAVLALRSLDIAFLVLEKVFIVGLPSLFNAGGTASKRIEEVNRGGLGTKGWKRLENAKKGDKRY